MASPTYDGKVVVITDATTPFAQECATLLAARGAKLVLNYPPTSTSTRNGVNNSNPSVHDVFYHLEDAEKIVAEAIEKYGTVHALVNNASARSPGLSYDLQSSRAWESMRRFVIDGAFKCAKAVWPHFRKNSYGQMLFIDPVSTGPGVAELAGRFALFGLAETLAREGAKYNIRVNVIAPQSPLYITVEQSYSIPELATVTSLALALGLGSNTDTACSLYSVGSDHIDKLRWERSKGIFLNPDLNFGAGMLATRWSEIHDFSEREYPTSPMDFGKLLPKMQQLPANTKHPSPEFTGKVVLVTGGASGLGRVYSNAFAEQGASVVVIDKADPQGVVDEIRSNGGKAAPVTASVEQGEHIVQEALNIFGRIDILVNNAGFVRDKSFANMDDTLWRTVMDVHLEGTYRMTKAVWPHFVRQRHGCIINTTSTSGIYGNFGQANYSAAKLGILGISEATAREGEKHNIRVNTIAPVASTGGLAVALSNTNDKNKQPIFRPEYIAPVVLLLTSNTLNGRPNYTTGGLFEVGCGWHASTRLRSASRFEIPSATEAASPEALSAPWPEMTNELTATSTAAPIKRNQDVLDTIAGLKRVNVQHVEYTYTDKDVILYNLSVGSKRSELPFIWEECPSFTAIPTFGVIPFFSMDTIYHHGQILPGFQATQSLLGELYLELLQDTIPISGLLSTTRRLIEVLDKGGSAVAITGYTTVDATTRAPLFYNELSFFMSGAGSFGGPRERPFHTASSRTYAMPARRPDAVDDFRTPEEQAAWYRLTGDRMAMHVDPDFSRHAGFPVPILHGMCSMGIAGKQLFQRYGMYRSIKVKFVGTVIPGQTLRTESWSLAPSGDGSARDQNLVVFQTRVLETGKLCIAGGGIEVREPLRRGHGHGRGHPCASTFKL
ncbi:hypothetical protein LTR10_017434 [Elasticomyces elasticus]|uniref:Ketoreductase domain-containing protein n=1 Tax=Exophiala sideris TaxID=1016849 RepID=A0ABR0JAJ0_9EURO|nr:hypothetical protein LTR10_017434 [Elasticomyces elasticus]KAK5030384.1 hypothetical protein LTS07_005168 [Exophiala sideris]KAK5038437.1 hypothetical protein LTR13_004184 [Exophiala sideris]KAK5060320.1 hypothetical protein LTR69_005637 [Exophiala sideris]KAK5183230.1 hypothetical protein LTR44_004231 [Eurotiomycetes sp. CCFEE 6388]